MKVSPFKVKICGVRTAECLAAVLDAGADAIGLNFVSASPRFLSPQVRQEVADRIPAHVARVGVFVNASRAEINDITAMVDLDYVQLHGDEPLELVKEFPPGKVIRSLRLRQKGCQELKQLTQQCERLDVRLAGVLVDAYSDQAYGGTGESVHWDSLASWRSVVGAHTPLLLAGGLHPKNVASAIELVRPSGVDVASGVERNGFKDRQLSKQFVRESRDAFSRMERIE